MICPVCGAAASFHVYTAWGSAGRRGYMDCWTCYGCFERIDSLRDRAGALRRVAIALVLLSALSAIFWLALWGADLVPGRSARWLLGPLVLAVVPELTARLLAQMENRLWRALGAGGLSPPWRSQ